MSKDIEKALSSLHALLGESPEASAAVDALRDLAGGAVEQGVITNIDHQARQHAEASVAYCLDRIVLAVENRIEFHRLDSYGRGLSDARNYTNGFDGNEPPREV